jgi:hypothetical protein
MLAPSAGKFCLSAITTLGKVPLDMLHACRRAIVAVSTLVAPALSAEALNVSATLRDALLLCCCACGLACERSFGQSNVTIRPPRFRAVPCAPYRICGGFKKTAHLWCLASESFRATAPPVGSFASERNTGISDSLGIWPSIQGSRQRFRSMLLVC